MVKSLFFIAVASFFSFAQLECNVLTEAKVAYFYPTSSRTRDIYTGAGLYSLELSVETWCDIYPWVSGGYFRATGRTGADDNKTILQFIPVNVGFKYMPCCGGYHPYLGFGVSATYMHTEDESPFVLQRNSKWGVGAIAKAGFVAYITECSFIDIFIDYTYVKICFNRSPEEFVIRRNANLSGLSFGGGFGWAF